MGPKGGPGDEGPVGKKGDKVLHTTDVCVWGGVWACVRACVHGHAVLGVWNFYDFTLGGVLKAICGSLLQGDMGLNGTKGEKGIDGRSGLPGPKVSIST